MALMSCLFLDYFTLILKIAIFKIREYVKQDLGVFLHLLFQNLRCQSTKGKAQLLYIHHHPTSGRGRRDGK